MPTWVSAPKKFFSSTAEFLDAAIQYGDGTTWRDSAVQVYYDEAGDITPPTVGFTSPIPNAVVSGSISITGTITDGTTLRIMVGEVFLGYATVTGETWSITVNTTPLPNGNIVFTAIAADASGNEASVNRIFVVNNVGAAGDITGPYTEPTYSTSTTSGITGTLILPTDSRLKLGGADNMSDPGTFPTEYRPDLLVGTTNTIPVYTVTFNFSGQAFELYYRTRMSQEEIRVTVNGKWKPQTTTVGYRTTLGSGVRGYTRVDFGTAAARTIRIEMKCWFSGIKVTSNGEVTAAATPTFKVVGLGDSLGGATNKGSGDTSSYYTSVSSYFLQTMQDLGWGKNAYNEAIGGSGFTVNGDGGGAGRYIDRTPLAVNARNPNVVLLDAHILNDYLAGRTVTQCRDALITVLTSMRAALPNANIICSLTPLVPLFVTNLGSLAAATSLVKSFNDPMKVAAVTFGAYVIDPLDGNVYDTDGSLIGNPEGARWQMPTGNTYPSTYLLSDGVHPTREGSWIFANQVTAAIRLLMPQSSWKGARGELNSTVDSSPPTVPTLQTPSATATTVTLTWTTATDPSGVAGYNVYLSGTKQNFQLLTSPTFTQTGMTPNTVYGPYEVTAIDASPQSNESGRSNQQSILTAAPPTDTTPPSIPTNLVVTPTDGGFQASWGISTDAQTPIAGYRVYINNTAQPATTLLTYTATGLTNGTPVSVSVTAYNTVGLESDKSTTVTVTPQASTTVPFQPTNLAVVPGHQTLRITWDQPVGGSEPVGYFIYFGGTKVHEERVTSTIIDELINNTAYSVQVAAYDANGNEGPKTAAISGIPYPPNTLGAPIEVKSFGPNGTHWPDRTPWIYGTFAKTVDVACTWAAIKTAVNALTDAEVTAGAQIRVAPGILPGSGGGSGSANMLLDVGKKSWRKRVLVHPRDGRGTVTFSNSVALSKVFNVCFANFDFDQTMGILFEGCSYSAVTRLSAKSMRVTGLGGTNTTTGLPSEVHTEGFDVVECVFPYVVIGDLDPVAWGGGTPGPAGAVNGNSWMRFGRFIGCYIAPQYRPVGGFGHNDALQMYGGSGSYYYGLEVRDCALWGSTNAAFQLGGWPLDGAPGNLGDLRVGPIRYFTRSKNTLFINASLGKVRRYPIDPAVVEDPTGAAFNGTGRSPQHYAEDVIATGSMYVGGDLKWTNVSNSRFTLAPAPTSIVGGWTLDTAIINWPSSTWNRISPIPDTNRLNSIWGTNPPAQTAPVLPGVGVIETDDPSVYANSYVNSY